MENLRNTNIKELTGNVADLKEKLEACQAANIRLEAELAEARKLDLEAGVDALWEVEEHNRTLGRVLKGEVCRQGLIKDAVRKGEGYVFIYDSEKVKRILKAATGDV